MVVVHLYIPPSFCSFYPGFQRWFGSPGPGSICCPGITLLLLLSSEHGHHSHVIGTDTQSGTRAQDRRGQRTQTKPPQNLIMQTFSELFCNICLMYTSASAVLQQPLFKPKSKSHSLVTAKSQVGFGPRLTLESFDGCYNILRGDKVVTEAWWG